MKANGEPNKKARVDTEADAKVDGEVESELDTDDMAAKKRKMEGGKVEEIAGGSGDAPMYGEGAVRQVKVGEANPWDLMCAGDGQSRTEEEEYQGEFAWDDVNDIELPIGLVKAARREEMVHMKGNIFRVVPKSEAWAVTGRAPISTKWVDTDKTHGTGSPLVRSRWVARDFKGHGERIGKTF